MRNQLVIKSRWVFECIKWGCFLQIVEIIQTNNSIDRNMPLYLGRVKPIWYLSTMRAAKVQASLRIRAVSPEPPLLAHTSSELRGTFRQKARSLASLNGWACACKICHDGMLEDTNSLDWAHLAMKSFHLSVQFSEFYELFFYFLLMILYNLNVACNVSYKYIHASMTM